METLLWALQVGVGVAVGILAVKFFIWTGAFAMVLIASYLDWFKK